MSSNLIDVTHDGFPLESMPPQGRITLHSADEMKSFIGFQTDYDVWVQFLKDKKFLDKKYKSLLSKYDL